MSLRMVRAGVLEVGCLDSGEARAGTVVLLHGFPYDVHCYDAVTPLLVAAGCRVVSPYLRGYGPTRFLTADTLRSGQQAALGHDLLTLLDALEIESAVLAGYDWGGRAACILAALWPERVRGLVSAEGYNIQDIAAAMTPAAPEVEHSYWYQYYFHSPRGHAGLSANRGAIARLLWRLWSPTWAFDDATFARSAPAFDNPDFVAVVIHSYRHRYGLVAGDPAYEETERRLQAQPSIGVPAVVLEGTADGVSSPGGASDDLVHFTGRVRHVVLDGIGHNPPQETPDAFADAVLSLL